MSVSQNCGACRVYGGLRVDLQKLCQKWRKEVSGLISPSVNSQLRLSLGELEELLKSLEELQATSSNHPPSCTEKYSNKSVQVGCTPRRVIPLSALRS